MIIIINYCDVRLLWSYACILRVHPSRFILTKCINRLHVSTSTETSLFSHTHIYSLLSTRFLFPYLLFIEFSSNRVHPHNFLIRFIGRTREHSAARRLLCFFLHANTQADA